MKQSLFFKIFFGCLALTFISYSFAGYAAKRAQIANPDVVANIEKHYNLKFQASGNGIYVMTDSENSDYEQKQKNWDIEGQQEKLDVTTKSADIIVEKSPDAKIHVFADGKQKAGTNEELFNVDIQKDRVIVKENETHKTSLRIQVPAHVKELELKSVSGDIDAKSLHTNSIAALTVSGEVSLHEITAQKIASASVSGDVVIVPNSYLEIKVGSTSGNITIEAKDLTEAALKIKSVSGDIINAHKGNPSSKRKIEITSISGDIELKDLE